jgi:hypothetical protein
MKYHLSDNAVIPLTSIVLGGATGVGVESAIDLLDYANGDAANNLWQEGGTHLNGHFRLKIETKDDPSATLLTADD